MAQNKNFCVVGIGASAGGFEALTKFFKALPLNTGAAYVIILHLSPDYESQSDKVLSNYTKLPVQKVTGKMPVKPDHIYVIPENKVLKINRSGLYLEERELKNTPNFTIDLFLESLATTYKENSVGIILSGTGSDGARGVLDIKAHSGMVMVQSPESASFDSMPTVSISSDHPDFIGTPDKLAEELS